MRRNPSQQSNWRAIVIAAVPIIIAILAVWLGGSRPFRPHEAPAAAQPSPPDTFHAALALTAPAVEVKRD